MCDRLYIKMDDTSQSPPPVENRKQCGNGCYYITLMIYNQRVDWGMVLPPEKNEALCGARKKLKRKKKVKIIY